MHCEPVGMSGGDRSLCLPPPPVAARAPAATARHPFSYKRLSRRFECDHSEICKLRRPYFRDSTRKYRALVPALTAPPPQMAASPSVVPAAMARAIRAAVDLFMIDSPFIN